MLSFANAFTLVMAVAAFAGTHYGLKWTEKSETEGAEAGRMIVFCLGAIAMIAAIFYVVGNDLRVVAVPGASFLCCMMRETRRIAQDVRQGRADLAQRLEDLQAAAQRAPIALTLQQLTPGTPFRYDLQDYRKTAGMRGGGIEREVLCHPVIAGLMQPGVECWMRADLIVEA
jgi:hypothetical protein